jgi:hypothetical protein
LDAYYDPNERKYFITPQSVELAIKEEQHKTQKLAEARSGAVSGSVPKVTEQGSRPPTNAQPAEGSER